MPITPSLYSCTVDRMTVGACGMRAYPTGVVSLLGHHVIGSANKTDERRSSDGSPGSSTSESGV
jgi:hypothetical protein